MLKLMQLAVSTAVGDNAPAISTMSAEDAATAAHNDAKWRETYHPEALTAEDKRIIEAANGNNGVPVTSAAPIASTTPLVLGDTISIDGRDAPSEPFARLVVDLGDADHNGEADLVASLYLDGRRIITSPVVNAPHAEALSLLSSFVSGAHNGLAGIATSMLLSIVPKNLPGFLSKLVGGLQ